MLVHCPSTAALKAIVVTGILQSGEDQTGVYGADSNLAGKAFEARIMYDTSLGHAQEYFYSVFDDGAGLGPASLSLRSGGAFNHATSPTLFSSFRIRVVFA